MIASPGTFPLSVLLWPLVVATLLVALFVFFNVFHILRFGVRSFASKGIATLYVLGFLVMIGLSGAFLSKIDWGERVSTSDVFPFSSPSATNYGI